jgi:hypothetical protein
VEFGAGESLCCRHCAFTATIYDDMHSVVISTVLHVLPFLSQRAKPAEVRTEMPTSVAGCCFLCECRVSCLPALNTYPVVVMFARKWAQTGGIGDVVSPMTASSSGPEEMDDAVAARKGVDNLLVLQRQLMVNLADITSTVKSIQRRQVVDHWVDGVACHCELGSAC